MNEVLAEQLLNEVSTISSSYKKVIDSTGERFNLFSILRMETDEVSTHSRFIAELLNPKGSHGQKDIFLKIFLQYLKIDNFETKNAIVDVEFFIGQVSKNFESGGRIDILIRDFSRQNSIMIENKIYAIDQPKQLLRYHNKFPKGKLLYLTLFGKECNEKCLPKEKYDCLSYEYDIINWLELCKKEAVNIPILRESISQYINLVKKLTNQNQNKLMNEDIINRILKDKSSFHSFRLIFDSHKELKKNMINSVVDDLILHFEKQGFDSFKKIDLKNDIGLLLSFQNELLKKNNLNIRLNFQGRKFSNLVFGLHNNQEQEFNNLEILESFKCFYPESKQNKWWTVCHPYTNYENWYFSNLENIFFDRKLLILDLDSKVTNMLSVLE